MKILCPGALGLLKDPVQALQIQEPTHDTYSARICRPGIRLIAITIIIDYCLRLRNYEISHPCPQDTPALFQPQ